MASALRRPPRPRSLGISEGGLNDHFCVHFLLSVEDSNHDVVEHSALSVHSLYYTVRKHSDHAMELDDFGFVTASGLSSTVLSSVVIFGSGRAGSALCSNGQCPFSSCV